MGRMLIAAVAALLTLGPATVVAAQSVAPGTPPAPSNLAAAGISASQIRLTWDGALSNGTYRIERSADGTTFAEVGSVDDSKHTFTDSGLLDDASYSYRIRSRKGSSYSTYSNVASALTLQGNNWRTFGGNPQHSGQNGQESGDPPLTAAWTTNLNPANPYGWVFPVSPLVVENGRIFATMSPNTSPALPAMLWSLDVATGQISWSRDLGFVNVADPAVRHGRVFVAHDQAGGGTPGVLEAFNASTGAPIWSSATGQRYNTPFPAGQTYVYMITDEGGGAGGGIGAPGGSLLAFNPATGGQAWANVTLEGGGPLPSYNAGAVYAFTAGKVRKFDAVTGAGLWAAAIAPTFPSSGRGVVVAGGGLVFVVYQRVAYALNPATGATVWTQTGFTLDDTIAPAYADGVLYVNQAGSVTGLDAATGAPVWSFPDNFAIAFPPVIANNHLFLASRNDLYAVHLGTRQTVYRETNTWAGLMSVVQGKLLVARIDGVVKAYTLSTGTLPNQSSVPAAPASLTATTQGTGSVKLSWSLGSSNETGVVVERAIGAGAYVLRTRLGRGATSFLDSGLANPKTYTYRVRAENAAGTSGPSNVVPYAPAAPGNVWSMLAHDAQHSGVNAKETGKPPATLVWEWTSGVTNPWMHGIAVEDNRVFAATKDQFSPIMTALDASTGTLLWSQTFGTGGDTYGPPSVVNGRVYWSWFNNPNSKFMCAEAVTGRLLWGASLLADGYYGPTQAVVANDAAYVTGGVSSMGWLSTFNADDGRLGWINPSGYQVSVQGTNVYMHWQDTFRGLDPATGNALWTTAMPVGSVPAVTATRGYGVTNRDLFAINLSTHAVVGTVLSNNLNNFYTEPAVSGGNLYWISDGALQVRRESDLALLWSFAGDGELRSRPVVANGYLYVSSLSNTYVLRISTHAVVATIPVGGTPTVAAGKLFIQGLDGVLRAYQLH